MNKRQVLSAAAALLFSGIASAQSTVGSNFNVSVTFTPICAVMTGATDINFGSYTPFTNAAISLPTASTVRFRCSRGLAPTVAFDAVNGTTSATAATGATAVGVLKGLRYTLSINSVATALTAGVTGVDAVAGAGGTGGTNSTANEYLFTIAANMAGNQAGSSAGVTTHQRTVILTY